jgi:hypothetical protein
MSNPEPTAPDPRPTLDALLKLAAWQAVTPVADRPHLDESQLVPPLEFLGGPLWAAVRQRLLDSAQAEPRVALRRGGAGPLTEDVAALVRGAPDLVEAVELDLVVRWWQAARRAGLAVDADFGEVWRACEWTAARQQLLRLAEAPSAAVAVAARVSRIALRYGPLKPLLRLLERYAGPAAGAGYTF